MMILSQLSVSGTTGQFSRQGQVFITRLKRYKVILQYNSQGLGHVGKESSKRDQFELKISVCLALSGLTLCNIMQFLPSLQVQIDYY